MKNNAIFLDKLTVTSFVTLLRKNNISTVLVLEENNSLFSIFSWLLKMKDIESKVVYFFQGDLKAIDGESVFLLSNRISAKLSLSESHSILKRSLKLKNIKLERNPLSLAIAKKLQLDIVFWTDRCSVATALSEKYATYDILIKKPLLFNPSIINKEFAGLNINFYKSWQPKFINLLIFFISLKVRKLIHFLNAFKEGKHFDYPEQNGESVFSLQEDDIGTDASYRRQPFWVGDNTIIGKYNHIILRQKSTSFLEVRNQDKLRSQGVFVAPSGALWKFRKKFKNTDAIKNLKDIRHFLFVGLAGDSSYTEKYFSIYLLSVLEEAKLMASFALQYNVKVFVFSDSYFELASAMLLISPSMNIKTIGMQYSNLGQANPVMISEPDTKLIFSNPYKKVFHYHDISPINFKIFGYINRDLAPECHLRAVAYRQDMKALGVKFVISYFNESVQKGCFGLVSEERDLQELHAFISLMLKNKDIGLIIKTQFLRTVPSRIYQDDLLIKQAILTGRYVEITQGNSNKVGRNNVHPGEVALASDLCISHKYGATAGLEAAVFDTRVVLLDTHGVKTIHDKIYSQADVVYQDIDVLTKSIVKFKEGDLLHKNLGDWSGIVHNFHSKLERYPAEVLCDTIDSYMFTD